MATKTEAPDYVQEDFLPYQTARAIKFRLVYFDAEFVYTEI